MWNYILRRILYTIPILLGVALLTFFLFTVFGEDPVRMTLGKHASEQAIFDLRHKWGLDKPLWHQFIDFLYQIVSFDYGQSYATGEKLIDMLKKGALVSLALTFPPFIVGTFLNIVLGLLIAYYRGSWLDKLSRAIFVACMSVSYLVYVIVFQYVLAYQLEIFPIQGYEGGWDSPIYLALPWLIMMLVSMGPEIRFYRTVFLDEVKSDYIKTARSKGADEKRVLFVHLLKNAMIPVLTNTLVEIPFLITGAFLMERYFSIPGIGDITITAIHEGDFPIIKATTMLGAILFAVFNLMTDVLYALFDPRVKLS